MSKHTQHIARSIFGHGRLTGVRILCLIAVATIGSAPAFAQDNGDGLLIEEINTPEESGMIDPLTESLTDLARDDGDGLIIEEINTPEAGGMIDPLTESLNDLALDDGDLLIIEELDIPEEGDMLDSLTESLTKSLKESTFLTVGGFWSPSGQNKRNLYITNGGLDWQVSDNLQIYLEGRAWQQEINFRQTRKNCDPASDTPDNPCERTTSITSDEVELNEGYIAFSPIPQINIKAGRRKVVWGQFDIFSPVFFTLPFRTQNIGTDFSKVNFGLPQDNVQISLTPHERIELQGYFFLNTLLDPLLVDGIQQSNPGISRQDLQNHNQYAGRIMFYPDWGTIGLTYLNGRNSFFINRLETVNADSPDGDDVPGLSKLEAYSVEASIPIGRWTIKSEVSFITTQGDLDRVRSTNDIEDGSPQAAYWRRAVDHNGGNLYGDVQTVFGGAGFEYQAERWKAELAGFFFHQTYTGEAKTLSNLIAQYDDPPLTELQTAPFLNAAYYITEDKKTFIGLTAGFLGAYAIGGSLYVVGTFEQFEHLGYGTLQLIGGLDALQYQSDTQLSDLNDGDDGQYDIDDDLGFSPRIGIIWKF